MTEQVGRVRPTKADLITRELRTMISCGELARGSRVGQDRLAGRFHTSVTPVREAIRRLESEGLLINEPHRGARVASADLEAVKGVYIARRMIEPYAAQRAARRLSRQDIDRVSDLHRELANAVKEGRHRAVMDANWAFHFYVYCRSGVPSLTDIIESLWFGYPWDILVVDPGRMRRSVSEHAIMVRMLTKGDGEGVYRAFDEHVRSSYLAVARLLSSSEVQDVFDVGTE